VTSYTRTAPNGKSYTINGPEGASETDIRTQIMIAYPEITQDMQRKAAPPTTRAEAKEQNVPRRSLKDYAGMGGRAVMQGLGDLGEMAQMVNPLVAISRTAAKYLPEGKAKLIAQSLGPDVNVLAERGADALKLAKAETAKEKLATAALRGATGSIVPGGGAKALVSAALSGAASGLGGEGARQLELGPAGEIAGSVIGGFAPSGLRGVKELTGLGKSYVGNASERAAKALQANVTNRPAAVAELERQRMAVPGSRPTSAELAGDTGFAALERDRLSTAITDRRAANAQARTTAAGEAIGEAGDVAAVPALGGRVAAREQARIQADLARQEADRATALGRAKEDISPVTERADVGSDLRGDIEGEYEAAKQVTKTKYENPILSAEHPVRFDKTLHADITNDMYKYYGNAKGDPPKGVQKILEDTLNWSKLQRSGKELTNTSVIANVDQRLADFAGEMTMRGRKTEAAFANRIRQTLDNNIADQMPADFKAALADAKAARNEQGLRFEDPEVNPVAKAIAENRYNRAKVSDVELPEKLIKRGTAGGTAAQALVRAVGRDVSEPRVRAVVRDLVDTGKLTPDTLKDFQYLLKEYPDIEKHVKQLHLTDEMHQVKALEDTFKGTALGKVGAGAEGGAQKQISSMLVNNNGAAFKNLLDDVRKEGDPDALGGVRLALAEHVKTGGGTAKRDAANNIIPDNDRTLRSLEQVLTNSGDALAPAQREALEAIRTELGRTSFVKGAGVPTGHTTKIGTIPGKAITARMIRFVLEHATNLKQVDRLIETALLDPKEAARLLKRPTQARKARMLRALRGGAIGTTMGLQQTTETQ